MERFEVVIVIPAFNESSTISRVVKSASEYGAVIVVDDASTDDTAEQARNMGAIVISHSNNCGYDEALNSGFSEADKRNYKAIITFDADGQHNSEMIGKYIIKLKDNSDLVLGVRPKAARFSEWIFMLYTRYRFKMKDPLCGMKGYSMKLYRERGYFDSMSSIGTELATYGIVNGYKYTQIAIPIMNRQDKPRFASIYKSNIFILKALYNNYKMF